MRSVRQRDFARIIPVPPNWRRPVQHEIDFLSNIITSRSGREQRHALRDSGRWSFQFEVAMAEDRLFRLRNDLADDQTGAWFFPVPWRAVRTSDDAPEGQPLLAFEEVPFWMQPGTALIVQTFDTEEVVVVESVEPGAVLLEEGLSFEAPEGARVYEARQVRFNEEVQFTMQAAGVWTANLRLSEVPVTTPPALPSMAGLPSFAGTDLFLDRPNWGDLPTITLKRERENFDPGRGRTHVITPVDFTRHDVQFEHFERDTSGAEWLIGFFSRQKGRRGSFWMPSWTSDFRVRSAAGASVVMHGSDFFYARAASVSTHKHVIAFWPNGGYQINTITGLSINLAGDTVVTFGSSWANPVGPSTRLHWLLLRRFAADKITVDWLTTRAARIKFSTTTLMTEEVE